MQFALFCQTTDDIDMSYLCDQIVKTTVTTECGKYKVYNEIRKNIIHLIFLPPPPPPLHNHIQINLKISMNT